MKKTIQLRNQEVFYTLKKSDRAQRLCITIDQGSGVVVTLPQRTSMSAVEKFLTQKAAWILRSLEYFKHSERNIPQQYIYGSYVKNKDRAYEFAIQKIQQFNKVYGYRIKNVRIKNQKTIWGSCSRKGNINFNYKILFLPEHMAEYIVVHELCHIQEQNHSVVFWDLVAKFFPDHREIRRKLRKAWM